MELFKTHFCMDLVKLPSGKKFLTSGLDIEKIKLSDKPLKRKFSIVIIFILTLV